MAVFRVERNSGYTVMSNHHLRNKELTLKAKGLLSQMLSLPEDWDYTLAGLSHINRESIDAIRTAVWELEKAGYTGMALGVDMYAAEIVLDLKSKYSHITLESAIPCETQAIKWSVASRERYYNIAAKCDKETMLQREYTPDCMDKRNRYMVDQADYILAVWNGCPSPESSVVKAVKYFPIANTHCTAQ